MLFIGFAKESFIRKDFSEVLELWEYMTVRINIYPLEFLDYTVFICSLRYQINYYPKELCFTPPCVGG